MKGEIMKPPFIIQNEMWKRNLSEDDENPLGATSQGWGGAVKCCVTGSKNCKNEITEKKKSNSKKPKSSKHCKNRDMKLKRKKKEKSLKRFAPNAGLAAD